MGHNGIRSDPSYSSPQVMPRTGPGVKLPPLWQRNDSDSTGSKQGINSRYLGTGRPKALSLRALRSKKKLLEPIETARNSEPRSRGMVREEDLLQEEKEVQGQPVEKEENPPQEDKGIKHVDIQEISIFADNE